MSLANAYYLLILTVSAIGLIRFKKLTIPFKILALSVSFTLLLGIPLEFFIRKYKTNAPVLQIECLTDYLFYSLTYYYVFKNTVIKKFIIISIVIITPFFILNAIFLQPFSKVFPTNLYYPTQVLFAAFSLLLFNEMLMYPVKINIVKQSVFWFNTAMLFYATTMFFNLGLSNYLGQHKLSHVFADFLGYFWYFMLAVFNIFIAISFLTYNKEIVTSDA
jgi:hypothetical protein